MADRVSILIPALHSGSLRPLLEALASQTAAGQIEDIIIAGQQDLSDCQGFDRTIYVPVTERPTPARNRNAAASHARGGWLCFTDSDCIPRPDWIEHYLDAMQPARAALAGSVAIPPGMPYWGRCDHFLGFEQQAEGWSRPGEIEYAATLNFCCRADVFRELNGFNEMFETAGGEDREFCWRLGQNGYKINSVPDAVVVHQHFRKTFHSAWEHIYHYGQVTAQFRFQQNDQASHSWTWGKNIAAIPGLGEAAGLARAVGRMGARLLRHPVLFRQPEIIPGLTLLDLAHTMGMIATIRSHDA